MGLDSVELIMDVEKHFSISIPDRESEKAARVGDLVNVVAKILNTPSYNFNLRESVFTLVSNELKKIKPSIIEIHLNDLVLNTIDIDNTEENRLLESLIEAKLPGIKTKIKEGLSTFEKLKNWFDFEDSIGFEDLKWKKYIDILIAANLERFIKKGEYKSKYEIYLAIMKITVAKMGVMYQEIGIEKSFTDDLGVD
jgi:acyl carrier protein